MEIITNEYVPLEYDEERLKKFYRRATATRNLSKRYSPGRDEVDLAMFADAMIGLYVEEGEEKGVHLDIGLARVAFAIGYLEGVPYEELDEQLQANPRARKMGVNEYALGVAAEGARHFRAKMTIEESLGAGFNQEFKPIDEFIDLDDTIKRLFHDDQISSGMAQLLLLLFRQQTTEAPEDMQLRLIKDIKQSLRERLQMVMSLLPHDGDKLIDQTFARGASYVREVLETTLNETTMRTLIAREAGKEYDPAKHKEYRDQVLGHMGYVIDKIYRRDP